MSYITSNFQKYLKSDYVSLSRIYVTCNLVDNQTFKSFLLNAYDDI